MVTMSNIMVSVIIPVYKIKENLLRACLNSLLKQDLQESEFIVIDDGSPDNCGKICDQYGIIDSRFNIVHVINGGVSKARNIGIKLAKGKYIIFVDGDDQLVDGSLVKLVKKMETGQVEMLFFGNVNANENDLNTVSPVEPTFEERLVDPISISEVIISNREESLGFKNVKFGSPWGIVFSAEFIKENNITFPVDIKKTQDRIFVVRALSFCPTVKVCTLVGYIYIQNDASVCRKYNPQIIDILDNAAAEFRNTVEEYYYGDNRFRLESKFPEMEFEFFMNEVRLYFFHPLETQNASEKYQEFKDMCIMKQLFFDKCSMEFLPKKRKAILFLLKLKQYSLLYMLLGIANTIYKIKANNSIS